VRHQVLSSGEWVEVVHGCLLFVSSDGIAGECLQEKFNVNDIYDIGYFLHKHDFIFELPEDELRGDE